MQTAPPGTPLLGCIAKLNRADEHLQATRQAVAEFAESDFYETASELDYKGRLVGRAVNVKPPPQSLALLIGDCVHNFRSALDHLAYELAASYTKPLPQGYAATSAFPIFRSGAHFRSKGRGGARHKMRGMSRGAQAAIGRLQPFHRSRPELWPLWMLEELSNVDKHRLIHVVGAAPASASYSIEGTGFGTVVGIQAFASPIEERALLVRVLGDYEPPPAVQVTAHLKPEVIFDRRTEARSVRGYPVMLVLGAIRKAIGFCVFPELDAELGRRFPDLRISLSGQQG